MIEATVVRLDVAHEVSFARPAFEFLRNTPDILRIFYEAIAPRYSLAAEHFTVSATGVLSDFLIRIGLFGNLASLELRTEKMTLRYPNVGSDEAVKAIQDVTILAYDALHKSMPEFRADKSRFNLNAWVAVEDGADAAKAILHKAATPRVPIDSKRLGADANTYSVTTTLQSGAERWEVKIIIEPSALPMAHLFFFTDIWFQTGTKYSTIEQKFEFANAIVPKVLDLFELRQKTPVVGHR